MPGADTLIKMGKTDISDIVPKTSSSKKNSKEKAENSLDHKLTDAWTVSNYFVKINDQEVCQADITDFEAVFGGCEVKAFVKFVDSKGMLTGDKPKVGDLGAGGFVTVGYTDPMGCEIEHQFSISKVTSANNSKNQKLVKIELEDMEARNMKGTFKAKGAGGKKFTEAIKEHYEKTGNKKKFNIKGPLKEMAVNTIIPSHMDFHTFIKKEAAFRGFKYIKDRFSNYLVHTEHMEFDKLPKMDLEFSVDEKQFSFNRIVQFDLGGFNMNTLLQNTPTSILNVDNIVNNSMEKLKDGVETLIFQKDPKKSKSEKKDSGVKKSDLTKHVRGIKQSTGPAGTQQNYANLNNAQKGSIWVAGQNANYVGKKIKVNLPTAESYSKGSDDVASGEYEIYAVRDKIISGGYFTQELFLRRPGKGE